jgi:hypothetical protein
LLLTLGTIKAPVQEAVASVATETSPDGDEDTRETEEVIAPTSHRQPAAAKHVETSLSQFTCPPAAVTTTPTTHTPLAGSLCARLRC